MSEELVVKRQENVAEKKEANRQEEDQNYGDIFVKFFSSLRLAISLFILLTLSSILGTVIEQGKSKNEYVIWVNSFADGYGEAVYPWLKSLGFTDLYHSWWYTTFLLLLTINATTCFFRRAPKIWRAINTEKFYVSLAFVKRLKNSTVHVLDVDEQKARSAFVKILRSKRYKVNTIDSENETAIYATKGIIGRLGSQIAHISVIFIMLGGILGSVFEVKGFGAFLEGETYFIKEGGFSVKIDKFWIDYYDNGAVKDYFTRLTIIENQREVMTKQIQVNDPLQYNGIWLYQSSYGDSWEKVKDAKIRILDAQTNKQVDEVNIEWGKEYTITDLGLVLKLEDFVSDFRYDQEKNVVVIASMEHKNPAVQLAVKQQEHDTQKLWIFYNYPDMYDFFKGGGYKFQLVGYTPHKYTGLQIARDPGVNIVWLGFGLLTLGLFVSSFVFHRRIWIKIKRAEDGSSVTVYMGGNTNKNNFDFKRELDSIIEGIAPLNKKEIVK